METVKIGTVDLFDGRGNRTPFGRVNLTRQDGRRCWHFFASHEEANRFFALWRNLEKPWKLQFDGKGAWEVVEAPKPTPFNDEFADAAWAEGAALAYRALGAAGHSASDAAEIRYRAIAKADWFAAFEMDAPGKIGPADGMVDTPRGPHAICFNGAPDVQLVLRGLLITFAMDECRPEDVSLERLKRQIETAAAEARRRATARHQRGRR